MNHAPNPEELLTKIASRDEPAFIEFYDLLAPRIMGILRSAVPDSEAAEKILSSVFVSLWAEAGRLSSSKASPEAWLALRARALAADQARKSRHEHPVAVARLDSLPRSAKWLPDTKATALVNEKHNLLSKSLRQLPPIQARLLEMAIVQGQTEKQIAQELGQPEGKVRTDLRAAFRFMRHRMRTVIGAWTAAI